MYKLQLSILSLIGPTAVIAVVVGYCKVTYTIHYIQCMQTLPNRGRLLPQDVHIKKCEPFKSLYLILYSTNLLDLIEWNPYILDTRWTGQTVHYSPRRESVHYSGELLTGMSDCRINLRQSLQTMRQAKSNKHCLTHLIIRMHGYIFYIFSNISFYVDIAFNLWTLII